MVLLCNAAAASSSDASCMGCQVSHSNTGSLQQAYLHHKPQALQCFTDPSQHRLPVVHHVFEPHQKVTMRPSLHTQLTRCCE